MKSPFRLFGARKIRHGGEGRQAGTASEMAQPIKTTLAQLVAYFVRRLGSIPRTKLVKLVYLADERWSQQHGETLTGANYIHDNHGPNAEGNIIIKTAGEMDGRELTMQSSGTKWGKRLFLYKVGHAPRFEPLFPPEALEVIEETIRLYGGMSIDDIVAASKSTVAFRDRPQANGRLDMRALSTKARDGLARLQDSVDAFGDLRRFADLPVGDEEPEHGAVDRLQQRALLGETE